MKNCIYVAKVPLTHPFHRLTCQWSKGGLLSSHASTSSMSNEF